MSSSEPSSALRKKLDRAGYILLLLYVIAGIIYSVLLPPVARFTDEAEYLKLSSNLLHGPGFSMDGVHLTASRPPGYTFFLAAIDAAGGGFVAARIVQFLLLATTVLLVCRLWRGGELFAGPLLVTGLVICYPALFYTASTLYPQILSAFLLLASLNLMLATPPSLMLRLLGGVVFGALILEVPTFLLTLFVVLAAALATRLIRVRDALAFALAAAIVVGAWSARNAIVFHRFVPVASNSGMNLLEGNNPGASPLEAAANSAMVPYYDYVRTQHLDEFEGDAYYKQAAIDWIESHPGRALVLYLEKVLNFFNVVNVYASGSRHEVAPWKQAVMGASYLLLMGLLAWRVADLRRHPLAPRETMLLAIYVLSAFTSAIFFTRIRHRLPFDFLVIAVVAPHLGRQLQQWIAALNSTAPPR